MNSSCVGKPCVAFGPTTAHRRPESRTHNARECEGARRLQAMKSKDRSACVDRAACSTARHGMHTFHLLGDHLAMPVAVRAQCTHHGGGLRGEQRLSQGEGNKARFGACLRGHALAPTERHITVHRNVKHSSATIAQGKRASGRALNMLVTLLERSPFPLKIQTRKVFKHASEQHRRRSPMDANKRAAP